MEPILKPILYAYEEISSGEGVHILPPVHGCTGTWAYDGRTDPSTRFGRRADHPCFGNGQTQGRHMVTV